MTSPFWSYVPACVMTIGLHQADLGSTGLQKCLLGHQHTSLGANIRAVFSLVSDALYVYILRKINEGHRVWDQA